MDSITREALLNLLKNLRLTSDEMWHCYEMTWRIYAALVVMFPDQFPDTYQQADKGVSFGPMRDWRTDQLRSLDAAIALVQTWD
jgi:hypothetical protein